MIRPGSRERSLRAVLMVAGDFSLAWAALAVAVITRRAVPIPFTRSLLPTGKLALDAATVLMFGTAFVIALALAGFYRRRIMSRARPILLVALVIQVALVTVAATVMEQPLPRTVLLAVPLLEAILFRLWRSVQRKLWPLRRRDAILVGEPQEIAAALAVLEAAGDRRIRAIGYAGNSSGEIALPWLGPLEDPQVRAAIREVEEVICVAADSAPRRRLELLRIRGPRGYLLLVSSADALLASSVLGWMGDEPLIEVMIGCGFGVSAIVKRIIDVVLAVILTVLSMPLWIAVAVALLIADGRPVLLRQMRLGRGAVPFAMWKFRSMRAERAGEIEESDGERMTGVGRLLRRYRIDELPQLLNVIAGDMSLVGPRPERPEIVQRILKDVPDFDLRCLVRPGIAGLAQILAEYDSLPAVKLRYDLTYMCSWSLWLDVRLLFASVAAALSGTGM
jgi:lipopolysaccharide/colanic/teichoic acid biosynthesis glycosyltransferase